VVIEKPAVWKISTAQTIPSTTKMLVTVTLKDQGQKKAMARIPAPGMLKAKTKAALERTVTTGATEVPTGTVMAPENQAVARAAEILLPIEDRTSLEGMNRLGVIMMVMKAAGENRR
jgi:hypothetical protein